MQSLKALYFISITLCLSVVPKRAQQCSIQPATLFISANQEGKFNCSCNDLNKPLPEVIIWFFNNSVVDTLPITRQEFLETTISNDDDVETITSTLTFVIDSMSANVFNDTPVECLAIVTNGDSTQELIRLTAKLYIYGLPSSPSDVHVNFARSKMYAQWTHAYRHNEIEPTAYHVNITRMSDDSFQSLVEFPGSNIRCIFYEVCVMEETYAGIGRSACINTSSNISVLEAIDIHVSNVSLLNHTNTTSGVDEEFMVGCSGEEREVHMQGEFHNATVSFKNSTTSLELKLPAPYVFVPSHAITLELNLQQPRVEDLLDVQIEDKGSTVQLQCVYAEDSTTDGCLIVIDCDGISSAISINSSGEHSVNILINCAFSCVSGLLYGYANNHGVVANEPSVIESIIFEQCISSTTSSPATASSALPTVRSAVPSPSPTSSASTLSPTAQGSLLTTLFVLMSLVHCLPWSLILLLQQ